MEFPYQRTNNLSLMSLPIEIRQWIFNMVEQKDVNQLRRVSMEIQDEVDSYYHFTVKLVEEDPAKDWLMQRRIKECTVVKLLTPALDLSHQPRKSVFKYPSLIKKMTFLCPPMDEDDLNYEYTPKEVIKEMITVVRNNVKWLCVELNGPLVYSEFERDIQFELKELLGIKLVVHIPLGFVRINNYSSGSLGRNLLSALTAHNMSPKLNDIEISLCIPPCRYGNNDVLGLVVVLLCKPRKAQVQVLNLAYVNQWNDEDEPLYVENIVEFNMSDFMNVTHLKNIKLHRVPFAYNCCWWKLLSNQKALENVDLKFAQNNFNGMFLKELVLNNSTTIVSITITGFNSVFEVQGEDHIFDFAIIQYLNNIKSLDLECGNEINFTVDILNVHCIPQSLQELRLSGFKIASSDLRQLEVDNIVHLRSLELMYCGYELEYGVNPSTVFILLSIESLLTLRIKQFNIWDNYDEIDWMLLCLDEGFSVKGEFPDSHLDITRDTKGGAWCNYSKETIDNP